MPKDPTKKNPDIEARQKQRRRAAVHTSQAPSIAPEVGVYAVLVVVLFLIARFGLVDDMIVMFIGGFATILTLAGAAVHKAHFKLTPPLRSLLYGLLVVWLVGAGYLYFQSIHYPPPIAQGELTRGNREVNLDIKPGRYDLYAQVHVEPEKDTKGRTKKRMDIKGKFLLSLVDKSSKSPSQSFDGLAHLRSQSQRVTKRGSSVVVTKHTSKMFTMPAKGDGPYRLTLTSLDENLQGPVAYSIYPKSYLYLPILLVGLALIVVVGFLDYLVRQAREPSFFALAVGASFGLGLYVHFSATPVLDSGDVGFTVAVGAFLGGAFGYAVQSALRRFYYNINKKKQIAL
ncbi:MAG: hypothetical protein H6684_00145 [Deltaproteobacteria bacterium]|nr:hypothetical protein [Deltaproteobacteria bacterium]MCB9480060.1 hypothetical protein [Deltaproteobacteria bacterium]MCB9487118.1 hypothetical protein [Deltaproteobacteria bacterium]